MTWLPGPIHGSGNQNDLAVCPTDSDIVIVGGDVQGILRSTNSTKTASTGQTWSARNRDIGNSPQQYRVSCVAWHPTWPGVCYAMTGDPGSGTGNDQGGICVSADYGVTWHLETKQFSDATGSVGSPRKVGNLIWADNWDDGTRGNGTGFLYLGRSDNGVYRCPNPVDAAHVRGGYTSGWEQIWDGTGNKISAIWVQDHGAASSGSSKFLYIATTSGGTATNAGKLIRISNRHAAVANISAAAIGAAISIQDLLMLPRTVGGTEQDIYCAAWNNSTNASNIHRMASAETGSAWTAINTGTNSLAGSQHYCSITGYKITAGSYIYVLVQENENVTAGGVHQMVWRGFSNDDFATRNWVTLNTTGNGLSNTNTYDDESGPNFPPITVSTATGGPLDQFIGVDGFGLIQNVRIDPSDPTVLYVAGGKGDWKCKGANAATVSDANTKWYPWSNHLPVVQTEGVCVDPNREDRALVHYIDLGLFALQKLATPSANGDTWKAKLANKAVAGDTRASNGKIGAGNSYQGTASCYDPKQTAGSISRCWAAIANRNALSGSTAADATLWTTPDYLTTNWTSIGIGGIGGTGNPIISLACVTDTTAAHDRWIIAMVSDNGSGANKGMYCMNWDGAQTFSPMGTGGPTFTNMGNHPCAHHIQWNFNNDFIYVFDRTSGVFRFPRDADLSTGVWTKILDAVSNGDVRWGHMRLSPRNANDANDCLFISTRGDSGLGRGVWRIDAIRTRTAATTTGKTLLCPLSTAARPSAVTVFDATNNADQRLHVINKSNTWNTAYGTPNDPPSHRSCSITEALAATGATSISWDYESNPADKEPDGFGENHFGECTEIDCVSYNNSGIIISSNQFNAVQIWDPNAAVSGHANYFDTANTTATGTTLSVSAPSDGIPKDNRVVLVVHTASTGATSPTATDSGANIYTVVHAQTNTTSSLNTWVLSSTMSVAALSSGDSITVTTNSNSDRRIYAYDIGASSDFPDVLAHTGTVSASTATPTTALAHTSSSAYLIGSVNYGSTTGQFTEAAGWTVPSLATTRAELLVGDANRSLIAHQTVGTAGTYTFSGSLLSALPATVTMVAFGKTPLSTRYLDDDTKSNGAALSFVIPAGTTVPPGRRLAIAGACGGDATGLIATDSASHVWSTADVFVNDTTGNQNIGVISIVTSNTLSPGNLVTCDFTGPVSGPGSQRSGVLYDLGSGLTDVVASTGTKTTNTTAILTPAVAVTTSGSTATLLGGVRYAGASASFSPGGSWIEDYDSVSGIGATAQQASARQTGVVNGSYSFTGTISSATYAGSVMVAYGEAVSVANAWNDSASNAAGNDVVLTVRSPIASGRRVAVVGTAGGGVTAMTVNEARNGTWTTGVSSGGVAWFDATHSMSVIISSIQLGTGLSTNDTITVSFASGGLNRAAVLYDLGPNLPNRVAATASPTQVSTIRPGSGQIVAVSSSDITMLGATKYNLAADSFVPDAPFSDDSGIATGGAHLDFGRVTGAKSGTFEFIGDISNFIGGFNIGVNAGAALVAWGTASATYSANEVTVGTTATVLGSSPGVGYIFSCPRSNTATVYVGNSSLNATTSAGVYFDIAPGRASPMLAGTNENQFYVVAGAAGQVVHVITALSASAGEPGAL